jgi:hypothetical protein
MKLQPDFKEFLRLLLSHRVRFVIVGAHALAAHAEPRFTGDLDVFVEPTKANATRHELVRTSRRRGGPRISPISPCSQGTHRRPRVHRRSAAASGEAPDLQVGSSSTPISSLAASAPS